MTLNFNSVWQCTADNIGMLLDCCYLWYLYRT